MSQDSEQKANPSLSEHFYLKLVKEATRSLKLEHLWALTEEESHCLHLHYHSHSVTVGQLLRQPCTQSTSVSPQCFSMRTLLLHFTQEETKPWRIWFISSKSQSSLNLNPVLNSSVLYAFNSFVLTWLCMDVAWNVSCAYITVQLEGQNKLTS